MIRLFKDVWLVHESETADNPAICNWTLESRLTSDDELQAAWRELLQMQSTQIVCSEERFCAILLIYWNHILSNFHHPSAREELWRLYLLDLFLKGSVELYSRLDAISLESEFAKIQKIHVPTITQELRLSDLGYEFLLPNYLLEKKGTQPLLAYVRWCCWSLLASELQLFLTEIKTDIFSGHEVTGFSQSLYSTPTRLIPDFMQKNPSWKLVANAKTIEIFDYKNVEKGILALKNMFPTAKDMLVIFNNHARAHRDEQGVNSFAEPIEFIYADRYEELLLRDMEMDFRITYASEHLAKKIVAPMVSKIYRAIRNKDGSQNEYLSYYQVSLRED